MASRAQSITITYVAWDSVANTPKTGDVANHTLRWVKDGTASAPTNTPTEVDSVNAPGLYKLVLTASECTCDFGCLGGKSSTANVVILPSLVTFEQLPTAAPAASGGLPTVNGSNEVGATIAATLGVNVTQIQGSTAAAGKLTNFLDQVLEAGTFRSGSTTSTLQLAASAGASVQAHQALILIKYASGLRQIAGIASISGAGGATPSVVLEFPTTLSSAPTTSDSYVLYAVPEGQDVWDVAVPGSYAAGKAGAKLGALPATPAATGDAMVLSVAERAALVDKLLGRNIAGGSDGGRTVRETLASIRNKVVVDDTLNSITVYQEDDTTVLWTGTVTFAARNAIKTIDPA